MPVIRDPKLIDRARAYLARDDAVASEEDARSALENLVGFFELLLRWEAEDRDPRHGGQE